MAEKCQHQNLVTSTYIDQDRHGRKYAQIVYECSDCGYRYLGEQVVFANDGRGAKEPTQKDRLGR